MPLPEPSVHFHHLSNGERLDTIWPQLAQGCWRLADPETHALNTQQGPLQRHAWKPVLPDIMPIYAGTVWDPVHRTWTDKPFRPSPKAMEMRDVLAAAEQFFAGFAGRRIGVQLSGGLDSSIIIALLQHLGVPFYLVGMSSKRYEFRTERHIQYLLADWGEHVELLEQDAYLPMSGLDAVPAHQHPDMYCLNHASNQAMAMACQRMGVEVLLTGNGGDNVFAEALPQDPVKCPWLPQVFVDGWLDDLVYAPHGVEVVPFYANPGVLNAFWNLRAGQPEDNSKRWARHFFRDLLPRELVEYTYCADFWGLYVDGVQDAAPKVRELFAQAYAMTRLPHFAPAAYDALFAQDLLLARKEMYQVLESRVSMAVWFSTLQRALIANQGQLREKEQA